MFKHEEALIPGGVVPNISRKQLINVCQFIIKKTKTMLKDEIVTRYFYCICLLVSRHGPLAMLPGVIILRVDIQNCFSQLEFKRRILKPFDDNTSMMPDLVIFRIVLNQMMRMSHDYHFIFYCIYLNNVGNVTELSMKIFIQCFKNLAPILPYRVVGGVQTKSISRQLQSSFALLLRCQNTTEVIVNINNCESGKKITQNILPASGWWKPQHLHLSEYAMETIGFGPSFCLSGWTSLHSRRCLYIT